MLIIRRHKNEGFVVQTPSGDVRVMVTRVDGGRVFIGIDAPKEWAIERDDVINPAPVIENARPS